MTKRAYYDCPIKAYYMWEYHGFRYITRYIDEEYEMQEDFFGSHISYREKHRYYIHPDSMALLKPQVGDLISFRDKYAALVYADDLCSIPESSPYNKGDPCYEFSGMKQIIQRNGQPFIWPEWEEV